MSTILDLPMVILVETYETLKDISLPVLLLLMVTTVLSTLAFVGIPHPNKPRNP
jgi:hypothetical protein